MNQSPRPDEIPNNLEEQLLLAQAKSGMGLPTHIGTEEILRDAPRLVATYGGLPEDWDKMTSINSLVIDGISVQVHWYRNSQTGQDVEFKFKRQYSKISAKK